MVLGAYHADSSVVAHGLLRKLDQERVLQGRGDYRADECRKQATALASSNAEKEPTSDKQQLKGDNPCIRDEGRGGSARRALLMFLALPCVPVPCAAMRAAANASRRRKPASGGWKSPLVRK